MTNENNTINTMNDVVFVTINTTLLGTKYSGQVVINKTTHEVDLLGLCEDEGLIIRRDGRNLVSVIDSLKAYALHVAYYDMGITNLGFEKSYTKEVVHSLYVPSSLCVPYYNGGYILKVEAFEWDNKYYYIDNCSENAFRDDEGITSIFMAPSGFWTNCYYCYSCGCYVERENFNTRRDMCNHCVKHNVIEGYSESHIHNVKPIYFGGFEKDGSFKGLGFELEVDCSHRRSDNNDVAYNLCSACGLSENELRYAKDGSLDYGFEVISQPHTIREFWKACENWERMLKYLSDKGYTSHDAGTCGLHVHVSRTMFGKTRVEQDRAIAKIFSFYHDNWNDLARASRRVNFDYCDNVDASYIVGNSKYLTWKKSSKYCASHYVALNNGNRNTFEFRLGRGTLNAWSFFSWIDLTLTIAKNARRITIEKIESNDVLSWLGGIKESTAKYLYSRGSFKAQVLELFPSIAWEYDNNDNNE